MSSAKTKIAKQVNKILTEMYDNCKPKASYKVLEKHKIKLPNGKEVVPYKDYYIDSDILDNILDKNLSPKKYNNIEIRAILYLVLFGDMPNTDDRWFRHKCEQLSIVNETGDRYEFDYIITLKFNGPTDDPERDLKSVGLQYHKTNGENE